jgi:hypothetical protein
MKNFRTLLLVVLASIFSFSANIQAQDDEEAPLVDVGADLVNVYVWRGTSFSGPAIQPWAELGLGNFAIGAWGSYDFASTFAEADLYLSYSFDFGLSLGLTDYYYPEAKHFEFTDTAGSHAFEINAGYEVAGFSLTGNYILNEAGGAGSHGGDMYFELGYSIKNVGLFVGAGNGWHTVESAADETMNDDGTYDDVFSVVNVGISASKEVKITDSYSLPLGGAIILNPYTQAFHVVATISF